MFSTIRISTVFASLVCAASAYPPTPPGTVFCETFVAVTGPPIIAITPGTSVTGWGVAVDVVKATLEPKGFTGGWQFANGGIGAYEGCHYWWLNIQPSPKSYKPLEWAFDNQVTKTWVAAPGAIVQGSVSPTSKVTSTFLACTSLYASSKEVDLYLQTGSDVPPLATCVETQLFVNGTATTGI